MKILLTNAYLDTPHGSEMFTATLANHFSRENEVFIFSTRTDHEFCSRIFNDDIMVLDKLSGIQFDLAIIGHPSLMPPIEADMKAVICHGFLPFEEKPVEIPGAFYFAVSREIANHFPAFKWNLINQPLSDPWFQIPKRDRELKKIIYGSHRNPLPIPLIEECKQRGIQFKHLGHPKKPMSESEIIDHYAGAQLVVGTGRWIYQAIASRRAAIISDGKTFSNILTGNTDESLREILLLRNQNMTARCPIVNRTDWLEILSEYTSRPDKCNPNIYRVGEVARSILRIFGIT